jgi:hypothetical protein
MNPHTAQSLAAQHRDDLIRDTASLRHGPGRRIFPRWQVSWSRTVLAPATGPVAAGRKHASRRGSSLVIIISARRAA